MASPAPHTPETGSPVSASRRSPWPRRLGIGALVVLALAAVGSLVLSRALDSDRVAGWLEPRVSRAVNRPVSLEGATVGLFPLSVRLQGLRIGDPTGLAPSLASLDEIELRVRLLPLLQRQVTVKEIRLVGMRAALRVNEDGTTNFGDFSPAPRPSPTESGGGTTGAGAQEPGNPQGVEAAGGGGNPFSLSLDNIRLADWAVSYESLADSVHLELRDFGGTAAVLQSGGSWEFQADWEGQVLVGGLGGPERLSSGVPVALEASLRAPDDFTALTVDSGLLRVDAVSLEVEGAVSQLRAPVREVALRLRGSGVPVSDVLAALPRSPDTPVITGNGTLGLDLAASGPVGPGSLPRLEGSLTVRDGSLEVDGSPVASQLAVDMEVDADRTARPVVEGRILNGPARITGQLRWEEGLQVDLLTAVAPELQAIPATYIPTGVSLRGTVPAEVRVAGALDDLYGMGFWGTAGVRNLRVEHPASGLPVSIATADLTLEGGQATLPESRVLLGEDAFRVQGTFSGLLEGLRDGLPVFMGRATGPRLDLVAVSPDPPADTSLTWGRVALANVGGRRVRGLSAADAAREMGLERPVGLPFQGELRLVVDTVLDRKGRMEDLRATVLFSPELVQLTDATFRRYGGRIAASGSLELGDDPEEPFSLSLQATGVDAGLFLGETTPLGRVVQGTLDLDVDLTGALDALLLPSRNTLQGAGRFALTGGGLELGALGGRLADFLGVQALANPSVRDWRSGFILRDGRVVLDEAALSGAPGDPRVGGGVGLDGGLDLVTAFDLPREELAAAAVDRLGLPATLAGQDLVSAVLRVGGTVSDPAVRADPGAAVRSATGAVEEAARDRINQEIQEQQENLRERATGALRGLLGGRRTPPPPPDTVNATPPDTTSGSDTTRVAPADTTQPDTVRPDTVRPDTTPPDTTRPDTTGVVQPVR